MMYNKQHEGLHLVTPKVDAEIVEMAQIYATLNPKGMIPVDYTKCIISTKTVIQKGGYVKLIKYDDKIHGFVVGTLQSSYHSSEKTVQQVYCFSNLKGILAYRSIVLAHEGLITYAENLKAKYVMSESNPLMVTNSMSRILAANGWDTFGKISLWRTSYNDDPSHNTNKRRRS